MPGEIWISSPDDWQRLALQLLKLRYDVGQFLEVPDTVHGDYGIEGFSRDGIAFQCYAPEGEPLSVAELTKRQKAKVARDLRKLVFNADKLAQLVGQTVLKRWVLLVPRWEDKELISYSEQIAKEVRAANLSFVAPDFSASIATAADFQLERQQLVTQRIPYLRIAAEEVEPDVCADWAEKNDILVQNLDRKAVAICHGAREQARKLREEFVRHYLRGRNTLEKLLNEFPELYETAHRVKSDREVFLASESLIPDALAPAKLRETLTRFGEELRLNLPGLGAFTIDQLIHEAVGDWLLRCPLDFPTANE